MSSSARSGFAAPWRWSVVTTPLIAAGGVFATGAFVDVLNVGVAYVVAVALFAVFGTVSVCNAAEPGRFASVYATAAVVLAGAWLVWTAATTAWSGRAVTVLLCGLGLLGPFWFLARNTHHRKRLKEAEEERRRLAAAEARRWPAMLAGLGMDGIVQLERVDHSSDTYSLRLRLPSNGKVKFASLKSRTEEIEITAGLRYGAINVERGKSAAEVWMHVNEVDVLARVVPLPRENTPLTINNPLPLGVYEDGTVLAVPMQGRASKTVGLRGKGKSNLINVKLAALTRCADVVIWMIDNKGGRTARPWLLPWLEGRTQRPVIDWVATTNVEVARMLRAAEAVIDYRSNSGAGGDKIIPTARMPELMIICEEVALIFGQHDMSNLDNARRGLKIVQLGRAEAVSVDLVAQRGTVTMLGGGDLKSQLENTFGLGVADANDARYTFGDTKIAADLARLEHAGSMLVQAGRDTRIVPAKAWWIEYADIGGPGGIAEQNSYIGPDLDANSAAAANSAGGYNERWSRERAGHLVPTTERPADWGKPIAIPASAPETTASRLGLRPSKLIPFPAGDRPKLHVVPDKPVRDIPPVLAAVHQVFRSTKADRLHTTRLLADEALSGISAKRLGAVLGEYGVQPLSQPFVEDGQRGRGYRYADVAAAVQRIADGRNEET
ncbi:hypothetical protein GCM10009745_68880 [Kribbella yunnanensis]|uniref:FtsK domain-containing protein n=1 Tax=Kribbella yunnanensis TaxID=190194 RepID=A0ABP4UVL3_9ACTN